MKVTSLINKRRIQWKKFS